MLCTSVAALEVECTKLISKAHCKFPVPHSLPCVCTEPPPRQTLALRSSHLQAPLLQRPAVQPASSNGAGYDSRPTPAGTHNASKCELPRREAAPTAQPVDTSPLPGLSPSVCDHSPPQKALQSRSLPPDPTPASTGRRRQRIPETPPTAKTEPSHHTIPDTPDSHGPPPAPPDRQRSPLHPLLCISAASASQADMPEQSSSPGAPSRGAQHRRLALGTFDETPSQLDPLTNVPQPACQADAQAAKADEPPVQGRHPAPLPPTSPRSAHAHTGTSNPIEVAAVGYAQPADAPQEHALCGTADTQPSAALHTSGLHCEPQSEQALRCSSPAGAQPADQPELVMPSDPHVDDTPQPATGPPIAQRAPDQQESADLDDHPAACSLSDGPIPASLLLPSAGERMPSTSEADAPARQQSGLGASTSGRHVEPGRSVPQPSVLMCFPFPVEGLHFSPSGRYTLSSHGPCTHLASTWCESGLFWNCDAF